MKQSLPEGNNICPLEKWKPVTEDIIPGVLPLYQVSTYGRIISSHYGIRDPEGFMSIFKSGHGYLYAQLKLNNGTYFAAFLHTLVLKTFGYVEGCENMIANHKDGVKTHNYIWNLEWVTHAQNIMHANILFDRYGENSANNKLDTFVVKQICDLFECGCTAREIREILGLNNIDDGSLRNIKNGVTWIEISINYSFLYLSIHDVFTANQFNQLLIMGFSLDTNKLSAEEMLIAIGIDLNSISNNNKRRMVNLVNKIKYDMYGRIDRSYEYLGGSTTSH